MREVLVVVFWLWLLVALGVYGYRIVRRVTQGPKAERAARAADADRAGVPRGLLGRTTPPPLPEGPVEARLPRSLEGVAPEGGVADAGADSTAPPDRADPAPAPLPRVPTLADALAGIRMPDGLLPVVDVAQPGTADGRTAHFAAAGATVPEIAEALAGELRLLDYLVDGLDTTGVSHAGLSARRDDVTVTATVDLDETSGAVNVTLRT